MKRKWKIEWYFYFGCLCVNSFIGRGTGAENVKKIIQDAIDGNATIKINRINLLEVYYKVCNVYNQDEANKTIEKIKEFPIEIIIGLKEVIPFRSFPRRCSGTIDDNSRTRKTR